MSIGGATEMKTGTIGTWARIAASTAPRRKRRIERSCEREPSGKTIKG